MSWGRARRHRRNQRRDNPTEVTRPKTTTILLSPGPSGPEIRANQQPLHHSQNNTYIKCYDIKKIEHHRHGQSSSVGIDVNGPSGVVRSEHLQELLLGPVRAAKIPSWRMKRPFIFPALSLRSAPCCLQPLKKVCVAYSFTEESCHRRAKRNSGLNRGSVSGPMRCKSMHTFAQNCVISP